MKTVGNVMLEFDPCYRALVNPPCVQDSKLGAVGFWDIQLDYDVAIILFSFLPALPA